MDLGTEILAIGFIVVMGLGVLIAIIANAGDR